VENRYTPATPKVRQRAGSLVWPAVDGAVAYRVMRNGEAVATQQDTRYRLPSSRPAALREYQVEAIGPDGLRSFLSEPVAVIADAAVKTIPASAFGQPLETGDSGYTGDGYLPLSTSLNTDISVEVTVEEAGEYAIDVRYANGHGPVNTSNKAAIRTLTIGQTTIRETDGVIVMPQRGDNVWNDWGYSNVVRVRLPAGTHTLRLRYDALDDNMNRETNAAHLDAIRMYRVED